jgi:hypothetical protein
MKRKIVSLETEALAWAREYLSKEWKDEILERSIDGLSRSIDNKWWITGLTTSQSMIVRLMQLCFRPYLPTHKKTTNRIVTLLKQFLNKNDLDSVSVRFGIRMLIHWLENEKETNAFDSEVLKNTYVRFHNQVQGYISDTKFTLPKIKLEGVHQEDTVTVLNILSKKNTYYTVFSRIFKRKQIKPSDIKGVDVRYFNEGGFKRVYLVTLLFDDDHQLPFLLKVIKEDVEHADTGQRYNLDYIKEYMEVAKNARKVDISFHLPMGSAYSVLDKRMNRFAYTETILPYAMPSIDRETKGRVTVAAYLRFWLSYDQNIFFFDPKFENVVIHKVRNKYTATIIDLDNIIPGVRCFPVKQVRAFLSYGFNSKDIVLGALDAFYSTNNPDYRVQLEEFITHASQGLAVSFDKRAADSLLHRYETLKMSKPYGRRLGRKRIMVLVNGDSQSIQSDTNMLQLLQESHVNMEQLAIKHNNKYILRPTDADIEYLVNVKLKNRDHIVFMDSRI